MSDVDPLGISAEGPDGAGYHVRYACRVTVTFQRIRTGRRPEAECKIDNDTKTIDRSTLGLTSRSGRRDAVRVCKRRNPQYVVTRVDEQKNDVREEIPWEDLIDDACNRALDSQRPRVRPQAVGRPDRRERPMYQVWPMLPSGKTTLLYGDSGLGKSWVGVYLCALTDHGLTANGFSASPGRSLFVDFEDSPEEIGERAAAIAAGDARFNPDWMLDYKREEKTLVDAADDLREDVEQGAYDLVVIDSFGMATGGDMNDMETVLAVFGVLRRLNTTVLIVDHIGKDAERGAIGSKFKRHTARSMWELKGSGEDLSFGLFHKKANRGRKSAPLGLNINLVEDDNGNYLSANFSKIDVSTLPELESSLTIPQRITAAISDTPDGQIVREALIEALPDLDKVKLDSNISRMVRDGRLVKLSRGAYGKAHRENGN